MKFFIIIISIGPLYGTRSWFTDLSSFSFTLMKLCMDYSNVKH